VALAIALGEEPPAGVEPGDERTLSLLLARLSRSLKGDARLRIATRFEAGLALREELATARDRRAWRRATAASRLGEMGSAIAVLADGDPAVRARAARVLGRVGSRAATARLMDALGDPEQIVQVAAAEALGAIGDGASARALLRVAASDEFDAARAAARALAR